MTRVHILAEGPTEETFIRELIAPYLGGRNIFVSAPLAMTNLVKHGPVFKGGITSYQKFKNDIIRLLKGDKNARLVTSMIDFYGLPDDFPGRSTLPRGTPFQRCNYVEEEIRKEINDARFIPHLSLHEFEAMVYVDPSQFAAVFPERRVVNKIIEIRSAFSSPEEINDNPETAPSKRLIQLIPEYRKVLHGSLIIGRIGLDRIRAECSHFDAWMRMLESL
jgi:hypothetical protein